MENKLLQGLNPEQIEAVTTTEGYVKVIAGAGSGKTKALTTRFAYLVDELDISPSKILSVTFTNKAANEMKERVMKMLGTNIPTPYIMTFHSFCNRFLRSEIEVTGISKNFKIMDTDDQVDILKVVYNDLGLSIKDIPYKKALKDIIEDGCKTGQRIYLDNYEELLAKHSSADFHNLMKLSEDVHLKIIYGYLREQKRDAMLDYDDLLNLAVYILKTHKDIREYWEQAFDYIQVDEFQDVSLREVELVGILSNKCNNLFVVGDDSQCIPEGSLVSVKNGIKKIEDIKSGDMVYSGIGHSEIGLNRVEKVLKHYFFGNIIEVKTASGKVIRATPDHTLYAVQENEIPVDNISLLSLFKGYKKGKRTGVYRHEFEDKNSDIVDIDDIDRGYKKFYESKGDKYVCAYLTDTPFFECTFGDLIDGDLLPTVNENNEIDFDEIVDVKEVPYDGYVYDINVKNSRNYIVNGCVVHNCIYSFRGADVNCIIRFKEIMDKVQGKENDVKTIKLTRNYRSTPEILNVSNSLIKCNKNRVDKTLITSNPNGPRVLHYHARNIYNEADWVAKRILSLKREFSDFAILYRSHSTSRAIEEKLIENSIPYEILSGVAFYSRKEIKDVLAILSLVAFGDNLSFMRVIKNLSLGIGPKKIDIIKELAGANGSLYNALRENKDIKSIKNTKGPWLVEFIETLRDYVEIESISMLMGRVFDSLKLEEKYIKDNEQDRWENLQELKKSAQHFEHSQGEKVDLGDYLGMLSLYTNQDKDEKPNSVKLMTVHGAKGLEFPIVFVVGMNEGIMPTSRTASQAMMEEERRIAYVAMTRAKEMLFLSDAEGENYDKSYRLPSRFLLNIPRDLYNSEGKLDEYLVKQTQMLMNVEEQNSRNAQSDILDSVKDMHKIEKGDKVRHKTFGEGKVMQITNDAYVILFEGVGIKGIRLDTNKLEKIG